MSATTALGWLASLLATSMFLPQLIRTYRMGFEGSVGTMVLALGNGLAWSLYGILRNDPAIVACNAIIASSTLAILLRAAADRRPATDIKSIEAAIQLEDATL